ncbi:hypothetical protein [Arthrobacter bambusae]|uniref:hypothetical protein n=1 Tax=Arthrobacter bambusae TaxID=1338426 RepID=UPI00277D2EDE|nr:hypothetical protein [Arthrobacter bambusae]MDQ0031906.1 hypothetical protein [Arthrobacter bambusae]MDQ0100065.1 hypothetical protein [Arthrobacter bambusae]
MSAQYTVSATAQAEDSGSVALAVASLPASFGPVAAGEPARVCALDGAPGWTNEAIKAIDGGALGIVVVNPVPENTATLSDAAEAGRVAVVLDQRWASNAGLVPAEDAVRSVAGRAAMLDTVATAAAGTDPERLLTEHLAAVVRVTGELNALRAVRRGPHGYTLCARLANGAPVSLQGVLSDARPAGVDFRLYTDDGGVSIAVPEPLAAWPAEIRATGPQGELLLPTLYESAHRTTWRRLKEHLDAGTFPSDLAGFARLTESIAHLS